MTQIASNKRVEGKRRHMARRPLLDENAQRVQAAYLRAKVAKPGLTQREFARKALPTIAARYDAATSDAERRRIEESGARYLRLIMEGKRTGRVNVQRADHPAKVRRGSLRATWQALIQDKHGNTRSVSMTMPGLESQLDIIYAEARLMDTPEGRAMLEARRALWRQRYDDAFGDFDDNDVSIRKIERSDVATEWL